MKIRRMPFSKLLSAIVFLVGYMIFNPELLTGLRIGR